ncbi:hypothetical protein D4R86_05155 [bacterium]|nr:MAG: hypothetical protein D4R86_05155 [bacterium]
MSKGLIVGLGIVGILVITILVLGGMIIGTFNTEVALRTTIEQKQIDNTSEFDNMWKKISQVAQVTEGQKEALKEILVGYANARSQGRDGSGSFINAIHEAIPNVDTTTFNNLQNIIVGSRDSFTMRQKELLDLKREHDKLLRTFPSNVILGMFGRKEIDITIVTSSRTEKTFETGKDDDVRIR